MKERCLLTGCMDDVCHASSECLQTGWPLAERCMCCGEAVVKEIGDECACDRYECVLCSEEERG